MRSLRPWLPPVLLGLLLGVSVPLLGQLAPPFHVPTHELSTAFALAAAAFAYAYGAWSGRALHASEPAAAPLSNARLALSRVVVALVVAGPAAWGALVLADSMRCGCKLVAGAGFFWLTWPPLALVGAVVGSTLGAAGWRRRNLLLVVLVALGVTLVHDGLQSLLGFRVVDLLVGKPLAFDQRATMEPIPLVHLYQRLLVTGVALAFWWCSAWWAFARAAARDPSLRAEARLRVVPAALSAATLALLVLGFGSHLGVGWGRGALHAFLSGELEGEHVVVRYPPGGRASLTAPVVLREAEWCIHRYVRDWGIEPDTPIHIYLFDDYEQIEAWTDTRSTHVVFRRIYAPWWVSTGSTLYHELAHALHIELAPMPTVVLSRGILEGLAEAYEDDYAVLPEAHVELAGALESGKLPAARDLMHPLGFFQVNESNAYDAAGSFLGFLVLEHGFDKLLALQRTLTLDFEGVYGRDLDQLDADWRAFLAEVPVDMEDLVEARDRFDPDLWPGYTARCCPKLGQVEPPLQERAELHWRADDWRGALEAYTELYEREPTARSAYQAAQCHRRFGDPQRGLAAIEEALDLPDLSDDDRFRLLQAQLAFLMELERWSELRRVLDERDVIDPEPSAERRYVSSLLRDPELGPLTARALVSEWLCRQYALLEEIVSLDPESEAARYLYTTRAFESLGYRWGLGVEPSERERVLEALARGRESAGALDRINDELVELVDKAVRAQDFELAEHVATEALDQALGARERHALSLRLERIAWERERAAR